MVPEVGGEATSEVQSSIQAMSQLTERIIESRAQTVVLISPHAPLEADSFVAYSGTELHGDFSHFRAPEAKFSVAVDSELLLAITTNAARENYSVTPLPELDLDHGIAVPLYFLLRNGWQGKVVALGYCFLSNEDHLRFGSCIRKAVDEVGRRVAFIASGDLSHRLKPNAPAGYNPSAHDFDREVVEALRSNVPGRIVSIDHGLRKLAGECGYRSMLVAIGAGEDLETSCEVMSYEAPFGVGYLVAQMTRQVTHTDRGTGELGVEIPRLAREAVETLVRTGNPTRATSETTGLLGEPAPCFVSLKTRSGELRGCIGTIEATKATLAEEIVANAMSAATHDPRFPPVAIEELAELRYSVDVLLPAEPTTMEQLDPAVYGVIVEDESGLRRGLLLPDIPGVETVEAQVDIAARKAGIPRGETLKLFRFKVERFREMSDEL
jgi:AmmeMemoRadiSam system protein A/AmmeMemoRadiSam system protein B